MIDKTTIKNECLLFWHPVAVLRLITIVVMAWTGSSFFSLFNKVQGLYY